MNKTEERYAWFLEVEKRQGKILEWNFEQVRLQLTKPKTGVKIVTYTPDFLVVLPDGFMRIDEVKGGFIREDSDVKWKLASELFPWFEWRMVQLKRGSSQVDLIRWIPRRIGGEFSQTHDRIVETQRVWVSGSGGCELQRQGSPGHQDNPSPDPPGDPS